MEDVRRLGIVPLVIFCGAVLLGMAALLTWLAYSSHYLWNNPRHHFEENTPSTWSSVACFLATGVLAIHVRNMLRTRGDAFSRFWMILGVSFILAGLDDGLRLHEEADKLILKLLGLPDEGIYDHLDDVFILGYGVVVGLLSLPYVREVFRLRGFVGFCFVGAGLYAVTVLADFGGWLPFVEEGAKMLAAACFLCAVATAYRTLRNRLAENAGKTAATSPAISGSDA
ncbi:MAG: hypothetical protein AAGK78_04660 [Planctomycetota bacterium]